MRNKTYYRLMDKRHAKAVQRCRETGKFVKKRKMCTKTFLILENILIWSFLITGMDSTTTWTVHSPIIEQAQASVDTAVVDREDKPAKGQSIGRERIEALIDSHFGTDAATARRIAKAESGFNPETESLTDRMKDGRAFSVGLYQINLTWHSVDGLNCPKAFSGKNYSAKVIDEKLYKECVQRAKDPIVSIESAKKINNWTRWSTF